MSIRFGRLYQLSGLPDTVEQAAQQIKAIAAEKKVPLQDYVMSSTDSARKHPDAHAIVLDEFITRNAKTDAEKAAAHREFDALAEQIIDEILAESKAESNPPHRLNIQYENRVIATGKEDIALLNRFQQAQRLLFETKLNNLREHFRKITNEAFQSEAEADASYAQAVKSEELPAIKAFHTKYDHSYHTQIDAGSFLQKRTEGQDFDPLIGKFTERKRI